jgi:hypothetical protein
MSSSTLTTLMNMRGLRNWLMLKGLSFSGLAKILLSKLIHRRLFCHGAQKLGGTPTLNMPKPAQISHPLVTSLAQNSQDPELQESTERRPTSLAKESEGPELQGIKERTLPSPA